MPRTKRDDSRAPRAPRRRRFLTLLLAASVSLAGGLLAVPAHAQSLDQLRVSGAIGEGYDGYARVRQPGGNATAVVEAVNAKRRAIYAKRAGEQSTTAGEVGRVYARQILAKAPPGTWFLMESGQWVRK